MNLIQAIQDGNSKEQRLQLIRAHLEVFDVEPIFPISLFEKVVFDLDSCLGIEPSCKVEGNTLFAGRFNALITENWPQSIGEALKFLDAVESRVGVSINRKLLERFLAEHIQSSKIIGNTIGIDLRPDIKKSSLKIHIPFDNKQDCDELIMTAMALDDSYYSPELTQVLLKDCYQVGFDFFLNGHSTIEFYTCCSGKKNQCFLGKRGSYLRSYMKNNFSQKIASLIEKSTIFILGLSKENINPVLYFEFDNLKDVRNCFSFNSLGDRIYGFCQNRRLDGFVGVGVTEKDIENNQLENFRFYYRQKCS